MIGSLHVSWTLKGMYIINHIPTYLPENSFKDIADIHIYLAEEAIFARAGGSPHGCCRPEARHAM